MSRSSYRFSRTLGGITYFANVEVQYDRIQTESRIEVVESIRQPINEPAGEIERLSQPSWVDAALRGIHKVIDHVQGPGSEGGRMALVRIVGSIVDTKEDAVECAAMLATYKILDPDAGLPTISDDRPWRFV